jgi:hypothetical protein
VNIADRFPKIPFGELDRLRDECEIPTKKLGDKNAVGAWRLAKQVKLTQAHVTTEARMEEAGLSIKRTDASKMQSWTNTVKFLTEAVAKGKFDVLDEFCRAWGTWQIQLDLIADSTAGPILTSGHVTNAHRRPRTLSVVMAIFQLQGKLDAPDRAPSFQEILDQLASQDENFAMDEQELSRQLKALGLQNRIPHKGDLGQNQNRF